MYIYKIKYQYLIKDEFVEYTEIFSKKQTCKDWLKLHVKPENLINGIQKYKEHNGRFYKTNLEIVTYTTSNGKIVYNF